MSVSQACNYALTALQQEFSACGKASNSNAVTDCNCTSLGKATTGSIYCTHHPVQIQSQSLHTVTSQKTTETHGQRLTWPLLMLV